MALALSEAITTLAEAEQRLHLTRTEDEAFFLEWATDLPVLGEAEKAGLSELRRLKNSATFCRFSSSWGR